MGQFILKYDIGNIVRVTINGESFIAKISGVSAFRNSDGSYSIAYDVKWKENGIEKVKSVPESEISALHYE